MKFALLLAFLTGTALTGCSTLPTAGPTAGQVVDQAVKDDQARFDVVDVDDKVVTTLLSRRTESFHKRFQKYGKPPAPKIGIGDTITVTIWEAGHPGTGLSNYVSDVDCGAKGTSSTTSKTESRISSPISAQTL